MESMDELLEEQLKDLFSAENQLIKALPKMAKKASTEELVEAFNSHLEETRGHVERLRKIASELEFSLGGHTCVAMQGLIEEGNEVIEEEGKNPLIDAALVAAAQRVEHYEIAGYGNARALADHLGHSKVVKLLDDTLDEEKTADDTLTDVCQSAIFPAADAAREEADAGEEELAGARSGSNGKRSSPSSNTKRRTTTKSRR